MTDGIIQLPTKTGGSGVPVYALSVDTRCPHFIVSTLAEGKWKAIAHLETFNDALVWLNLRAIGPVLFDAEANRV
jgi:hypothetical protein